MRRPFIVAGTALAATIVFPTSAASPSAPVGTAGTRPPLARVPATSSPEVVPPVTVREPIPDPTSSLDTAPESDVPSDEVTTTLWDLLAACESNGDWSINTGNGYYGGVQFSLRSWQWVGGSGYPHHASKSEQIHRAEHLLALQGWVAWPACSKKLGLR